MSSLFPSISLIAASNNASGRASRAVLEESPASSHLSHANAAVRRFVYNNVAGFLDIGLRKRLLLGSCHYFELPTDVQIDKCVVVQTFDSAVPPESGRTLPLAERQLRGIFICICIYIILHLSRR